MDILAMLVYPFLYCKDTGTMKQSLEVEFNTTSRLCCIEFIISKFGVIINCCCINFKNLLKYIC